MTKPTAQTTKFNAFHPNFADWQREVYGPKVGDRRKDKDVQTLASKNLEARLLPKRWECKDDVVDS